MSSQGLYELNCVDNVLSPLKAKFLDVPINAPFFFDIGTIPLSAISSTL